MDVALQVMMGVSLAACAGLRAWLPLLIVGLLGRTGQLQLNASYAFLSSNGALIAFGVATLLELLGDKVMAIDHFLDTVGTVARPAAGAVLVAAALSDTDPLTATVLGVVTGGGTALGLHLGKATLRLASSALGIFHGGVGNLLLSVLEDVALVGLAALAVFIPVLAFIITILLLIASVLFAVRMKKRLGRRTPQEQPLAEDRPQTDRPEN